MAQVNVDAEMLTKLSGLAEPLVFCDQQGRVLGRFVPEDDLAPRISMQELRRRSESFQCRQLSDLLAKWEKDK
jgi:hypothetical protein